MNGIRKPPSALRKSPRLNTEWIGPTGITSDRNSSRVSDWRSTCRASFGGGARRAHGHALASGQAVGLSTDQIGNLESQDLRALTTVVIRSLSTAQIAAGFLVPEATMARRLSRAKAKIADSGIRLRQQRERHRPSPQTVRSAASNAGSCTSTCP